MTEPPQFTLDGANIAAPCPDPAFIKWLRESGMTETDVKLLADHAAQKTQFMPPDIEAAYMADLMKPQKLTETALMLRALKKR